MEFVPASFAGSSEKEWVLLRQKHQKEKVAPENSWHGRSGHVASVDLATVHSRSQKIKQHKFQRLIRRYLVEADPQLLAHFFRGRVVRLQFNKIFLSDPLLHLPNLR